MIAIINRVYKDQHRSLLPIGTHINQKPCLLFSKLKFRNRRHQILSTLYSTKTNRIEDLKLEKNNAFEKKDVNNKYTFEDTKKMLYLTKPELKNLGIALATLSVSTTASLALPYVMGQIIDVLGNSSSPFTLETLTIGMAGLFGSAAITSFVRVYLLNLSSQRIALRLRESLFSSILDKNILFFNNTQTGELVNRLSTDTEAISKGLLDNLSQGARRFIEGVGGLSFLLYLSPKLTLTMLLVIPPSFLAAFFFGKRTENLSTDVLDALAKSSSFVQERLNSIQTLKAFGQEVNESVKYKELIEYTFKVGKKYGLVRATFFSSIFFIINISLVLVLYQGALSVMSGTLTTGELTSYLFYAMYVGFSFSGLSDFYTEYKKALGSSKRVFTLLDGDNEFIKLDTKVASLQKSLEEKFENSIGEIRFNNISFGYPNRENSHILKNFDITIKPGKSLAIVGASGSGKSTITSLLLRFYEPNEGAITIDGVDYSKLSIKWVRNLFGIVPQDIVLLSGTIEDNIRYGKVNCTHEEIIDAAKQANAHNFIMKLPEGYKTQIGEKGLGLSGGQKQRIAICRALIKNPKILLLDEATSSLDLESEYLIQKSLENVMKDRTVVVIAHRLSTIKNADEIIVLDQGQVVETGSYDELMNIENGHFKNISNQSL